MTPSIRTITFGYVACLSLCISLKTHAIEFESSNFPKLAKPQSLITIQTSNVVTSVGTINEIDFGLRKLKINGVYYQYEQSKLILANGKAISDLRLNQKIRFKHAKGIYAVRTLLEAEILLPN
jgi:hypothetical protein